MDNCKNHLELCNYGKSSPQYFSGSIGRASTDGFLSPKIRRVTTPTISMSNEFLCAFRVEKKHNQRINIKSKERR